MAGPGAVRLRLATRTSALALWQAEYVAAATTAAAEARGIEVVVELVGVQTTADRRLDVSIASMGGKGVFVKEVQQAVLDGRADMAVHSGKDLPALTPDDLVIAAVPERADPRDVLIGSTLEELPAGGTVATGSIRRRAQLAARRPDLVFSDLRGNIATRLDKAADFDAIVMAAAAIDRLGLSLDDRVVDVLDVTTMLPQVAQGALAVECRADDESTRALLVALDHHRTRVAVTAERGFLAELGGDCDLPVGAHAILDGDRVTLDALVAAPDGSLVLRATRSAPMAEAAALGASLARHLLDDAGGAALLGR